MVIASGLKPIALLPAGSRQPISSAAGSPHPDLDRTQALDHIASLHGNIVANHVSALPFTFRAGRMPPSALMLAVLLHVLVALALWAISLHPPRLPRPGTSPIDVTFEQPKPPPPVPPAKAVPVAPPAGLAPPAARTADKPSQVPSRAREAQPALAPEPPSLEQAVPPPQSEVTAPPAFEPPTPEPAPAQPSPSQQAHVSSVPTPAPTVRPAQPPPLRPSPLAQAPRRQAPALASREEPSPSPFVNPADVYNRARVADNYLWQVLRKLAGYHYEARATVREGTTVVRMVIARDGRLLDIAVIQSSGLAVLDRGVVAGIRAGAPYAPLPPEIHGDRASFTLPLVSVRSP